MLGRPGHAPNSHSYQSSRNGAAVASKPLRNQGQNASRTETLANSLIHGRKVDSPKIFVGNQVSDESRPKTSAQQMRKFKGAGATGKEQGREKKKANHQRKNATALNASQVIGHAAGLGGRGALYNIGPQTNKEVDSRKFDFGLPPTHSKMPSASEVSAGGKAKKASISKSQNTKMHLNRHNRH